MNEEEITSLIRRAFSQKDAGDLGGAIESYEKALLIGKGNADPSLLGTAASGSRRSTNGCACISAPSMKQISNPARGLVT